MRGAAVPFWVLEAHEFSFTQIVSGDLPLANGRSGYFWGFAGLQRGRSAHVRGHAPRRDSLATTSAVSGLAVEACALSEHGLCVGAILVSPRPCG